MTLDVQTVSSESAWFAEFVELFEAYRRYFSCDPARERAECWLREHLSNGLLRGYVGVRRQESAERAVGMALVMRSPASQSLGCFWAIRDLYVDPGHRRQGVARALLDRVTAEARDDGALRLALQTDDADTPARRLYESYGFTPVEGVIQLMLDLSEDTPK